MRKQDAQAWQALQHAAEHQGADCLTALSGHADKPTSTSPPPTTRHRQVTNKAQGFGSRKSTQNTTIRGGGNTGVEVGGGV